MMKGLSQISPFIILKMLIILHPIPLPAPGKTVHLKQSHAVIILRHKMRRGNNSRLPVVRAGRRGNPISVYVRVIKGIDIHRQPVAVQGESVGAGDCPAAECGGIIVCHGRLIVGIVVIDEAYFFDGVSGKVKPVEYLQNRWCDPLMDDQFTDIYLTVKTYVENREIAEGGEGNGTISRVGNAADAGFNLRGDEG